MTVNEEMNAEELAKRNAQERVTKPLHPEDVPLFIRESVEVGEAAAPDKDDANRE